MRYGCAKCEYETGERTDIRAHVRQSHNAKLGVSKGGELPINRIPTREGETKTVYRAPLKTIGDQLKEKLNAMNYLALKGKVSLHGKTWESRR